jgi:hypothetical protein
MAEEPLELVEGVDMALLELAELGDELPYWAVVKGRRRVVMRKRRREW